MKNATLFFNAASFRLRRGGISCICMTCLTWTVIMYASGSGAAYAGSGAQPALPGACIAQDGETGRAVHPRIYIAPDGKDAFAAKLQNVAWAQESYQNLKSNVDPYVDRHRTDPEWILSRMQMYWDTHYERVYVKGNAFLYGKGRAPVPTVKFAGHRDGATDYLMPSLEDTRPYMDEKGMYLQNRKKEGLPWEWTHPSKTGRMIGPMNDRILSLAADAAFLYWYTGEEKYAVFASDIFLTYVKGMHYRREPFALEDYSNSHLMGLATFEVILDHLIPSLALCYDFLHDYLQARQADMRMITGVLKRFADQQILYGVPDNNWNIFQARHIAYVALALDDDDRYDDRRGRQFYLDEIMNHTTIRQFALKEVVGELFDPQTGLWPESATYSMSVCNDLLDIISLIDNAENNRLLDTFPILRKAVPAMAQYLFPNGRVTAFGDARYVTLPPQPFEALIALYRKYGERDREIEATRMLRKLMRDGAYDRSRGKSLFSLFFYVDEPADLPDEEITYDPFLSDAYYAPNVSWLIQRNGRDERHGMAVTLTGAYGNHAHANGISLEMYGKGLLLAPESSYGETYGTRDNQEYYARFPAHNTVVVDGVSDYGMMRGDHPYRLAACYPEHGGRLLPSEKVTFARVELTEPKTDARQERLTSIIRTGETSAFAVDVFRSARKDRKDVKHEYIYHSVGHDVDISARNGQKITLLPTQELSSALGDLKGYDYFSNKKTAAVDDDFAARFRIELQQSPDVYVDMRMKGFPGSAVFTALSPRSNAFVKGSAPGELPGQPLPTLIVRRNGEAWNRPFVAVYHPYEEGETPPPTDAVTYFGENENFTGIQVKSPGRTDYLFNRPEEGPDMTCRDIRFNGVYAAVGEAPGGQPEYLFMGEGRSLEKGAWRILSSTPGAQVSLSRNGDAFELVSSSEIQLRMPLSSGKPPVVADKSGPGKRLPAVARTGDACTVSLPAGRYQIRYNE